MPEFTEPVEDDGQFVAGAGNIHYGDMLRVPLTTVSWSRSQMGEQAARLLIRLINGKPPSRKKRQVILPPELIVRGSTVGPSNGKRLTPKSAARVKRLHPPPGA